MLSIAVDETRGFVYWGDGSKLKQATFDGYNEKVIIDTGKLNIPSFTISYLNGLMKERNNDQHHC